MPTTVSRRTITKGAAWSVPVVALASAAPAAVASPACSFGLAATITSQHVTPIYCSVNVSVILAKGTCGGTAQFEKALTVAFQLNSPYVGWIAGVDMSPMSGSAGSVVATTTDHFDGVGSVVNFGLSLSYASFSTPVPVKFDLTVDGATPASVIAFSD